MLAGPQEVAQFGTPGRPAHPRSGHPEVRAIVERASALSHALQPVAEAVTALATAGAWREEDSGALLLGPRPDVGSHAYDIVLFPGASEAELEQFQQLYGVRLPDCLVDLLGQLNGGSLFGLNIYGVPRAMTQGPPLLNRSRRAPLDLGSGRYWRAGYAAADPQDVLFASRNVSDDGQIGYFMSPQGHISGRGNGGKSAPDESGPWGHVAGWLGSQLDVILTRTIAGH